MKLTTWNVNGIRALKLPIKDVLDELSSDIICLQETKVTRDQLESDIALVEGYSSYYSCSHTRAGYSGVATYCSEKSTPIKAQEGLFHFYEAAAGDNKIGCYGGLSTMFTEKRMLELDKEGRTVITQHKLMCGDHTELLTIINVYCPRADPDRPERKQFKLDFYKSLEERAKAILNSGSSVIVCGDINTAHRRIDHCDPDDPERLYDSPSREWMDQLLYNGGDYTAMEQKSECNGSGCFVDSFRYFNPDRREAFTCWCTLKGCRQTNYGTRLDYILADHRFHKCHVTDCDIHPDVEGSDHCPVKAELSCIVSTAKKCPQFCTKYLVEFGGRQQKLSQFFSAKSVETPIMFSNSKSNKPVSMAAKRKSSSCARNEKAPPNKQTKLSHFVVKPKPVVSSESAKKTDSSGIYTKEQAATKKTGDGAALFWKALLKGPEPPPLCIGHNQPCVMRTVKKEGPNCGKQFYCCARPEGHKTNVEARCTFFQWKN